MQKDFYTPTGKVTRELTDEEIELFSKYDGDARKEKYKKLFAQAGQLQDKINVIAEHLGLM